MRKPKPYRTVAQQRRTAASNRARAIIAAIGAPLLYAGCYLLSQPYTSNQATDAGLLLGVIGITMLGLALFSNE